MAFAGFDRDIYPGDVIMQTLISTTNLKWCGYYLHPAPSHSDGSWMDKRAFLRGIGWGLAPLYVGEQTVGLGSHNPSATKGTADGAAAANLMFAEGFPAGSYVYLDIENPYPPALPDIMSAYAGAWCDAVVAGGYQPGIYVSHHHCPAIQALRPNARIWAIFVTTSDIGGSLTAPFPEDDPSGSGVPNAFLWQCRQASTISIQGEPEAFSPIDFDTALSADPSA
jgi:glycoside hydrolase-like protein